MIKKMVVASSISLFAIGLTGCSGDNQTMMADLDRKIQEIKMKPGGNIDALPQFEQVETFAYSATNMRSIFEKPYDVSEITEVVSSNVNSVEPDEFRSKEPLEQFDIETLAFIGSMNYDNQEISAIIKDATGQSHIVKIGNFIGKNHGRIINISQGMIEVTEIIHNTNGWVESPRIIRIK